MGFRKGTFTGLDAARVGPGSLSPVFFVGLNQARRVSFYVRGSYGLSAGTNARLEIYAALTANAGSIGTKIGSIPIGAAASAMRQKMGTIAAAVDYPFVVMRMKHATGTAGLTATTKAIVQYDQ